MRIEKLTRKGKEFAVIGIADLQKLMDDAEMLADEKAYDAAKGRLGRGEDELIPLEITERRPQRQPAARYRPHRRWAHARHHGTAAAGDRRIPASQLGSDLRHALAHGVAAVEQWKGAAARSEDVHVGLPDQGSWWIRRGR